MHSLFLHSLRKNWPLLFLVIMLDIFFLYAFGKVYVVEFQTLSVHMSKMNALLQTSLGEFMQTEDTNDLQVDFVEFDRVMRLIYANIARVLLYLFTFWTLFQGCSWYFCMRMAQKQVNVAKYVWRFILISVVGFLGFLGIFAGAIYLAYKSTSTTIPLVGHDGIVIIAIAALLILMYGVFVGYSVPLKRWWHNAKNYKVAVTYVSVIILGVIFQYGLVWLAQKGVLFALIAAIGIVLPTLVLGRVFFIRQCVSE